MVDWLIDWLIDLIPQTLKLRNHLSGKWNKLSGIIIKEFGALRPKMYSYSPDDVHVDKTAKDTKNCVIKQKKHVLKIIETSWAHGKDLGVKYTVCSLRKLTRLPGVLIMIRE